LKHESTQNILQQRFVLFQGTVQLAVPTDVVGNEARDVALSDGFLCVCWTVSHISRERSINPYCLHSHRERLAGDVLEYGFLSYQHNKPR